DRSRLGEASASQEIRVTGSGWICVAWNCRERPAQMDGLKNGTTWSTNMTFTWSGALVNGGLMCGTISPSNSGNHTLLDRP
ncbi:hypothetical protein AVEN_219738-1, partial [Araneus ventricosus]